MSGIQLHPYIFGSCLLVQAFLGLMTQKTLGVVLPHFLVSRKSWVFVLHDLIKTDKD